ncbi:SDR family oxidoreductase [Micromonospora zingiberis]|uniref:SDR family oxidoreductase n=1 Tax=Micromonospora zingiberis TaxID=2053011 RepID=A0A4V2LWY3_9ACTN|nr:SDR family oxidoreductase [Micromonospora zingiberis]TCB98325.1 SDR family oxidoreductase [Micromonospora zingiberis]
MDTTRLAGKHILVTGAAQGMGAAVARHYAAQGAKVCLGDVNVDGAAEVAEEIRAAGGVATHVRLDVTSEADATAAVAHTVEEFGSINVLLNNAGINKPLFFLDITRENWQRIMDVNAWGTLNCMQAAARQMKAQGRQDYPYKIINVGSILSREVFDDVVVYSASKHAVLAMIKGGAKSLIEHNITVNGYGPGVVRTELWEQLDRDLVAIGKFDKLGESMDTLAENMILMKRYSYPEDVVGTAAFLASSDSDYMTGQLIMIDGGMVIQ